MAKINEILAKMKKMKWGRYICYVVFGALSLFLLIGGSGMKMSTVSLISQMGISIILAVSLSFVVGFLGELSLGHAGFMCIGAYLGGKLAATLVGSLGDNVLTFVIAVLFGGLMAAIAGAVIGLPALRLKGDYLAIVTLAFCEIIRIIFLNSKQSTFGGAFGLETPKYSKNGIPFYLLVALTYLLVIFTIAILQNIIRSKHGRAITAIRDNEIAARATGVPVTKYKLFVFIVSSFFAGVAGVVYSYTQSRLQSGNFDYNYSIEILVMVVLGGMGSINGSIIAAALITFLNVKLSTILTGDLSVIKNLIYALILIVVIIYGNAPSLKGFREKYNIKKFVRKIIPAKHDPATINNDEAAWDRIPTKIKMDEILSVDVKNGESVMDPDRIYRGGKR